MIDVQQHRRSRRNRFTRQTVALLALLLAGCSGVSLPKLSSGTRLSAGDFRNPAATSTGSHTPIPAYTPERPRAERVEIRSLTEEQASAGVGEVGVSTGDPAFVSSDRTAPNDGVGRPRPSSAPIDASNLVIVDAKVGDLNGLPIVARSWLEPLGPRLRAESAEKSRPEWRSLAAGIINDRLISDLQEELFLAEARSALTDQERAGLRVFLQRFEKDVVRSSYGSQTLADEQLRRTSGIGLAEAKRQRERAALVAQVQQRIRDRVQVTSRDLILEYERNADEFNPPRSAVFRLIRVRTDEPEAVAEITDALNTTPFVEVVANEHNQTPDPVIRELAESLAETELFGLEPLQAAASQLSIGQWQGPINAGTFTYWVYLDQIEDNSRTLYEAQLELRRRLIEARGIEESSRYLFRLFQRAGISNFDDLILRLVQIAEEWYYQGESAP
ncbi:MAG: hypothetical protein Q9O74_01620 [Planctomycetota bacterium]|nr:hypothetical protein [Planctomycetota bacterium]